MRKDVAEIETGAFGLGALGAEPDEDADEDVVEDEDVRDEELLSFESVSEDVSSSDAVGRGARPDMICGGAHSRSDIP